MNDSRLRIKLTIVTAATEPIEILTSMGTIGFGAWLLLPAETFDKAQVWKYFAVLPEWAWGTIALTVGMLSLCGTLFNLWHVRVLAQYLCVTWWLLVGGLSFAANPASTAMPWYITQIVGRTWTALRLLGIIRRPRLGLLAFDDVA